MAARGRALAAVERDLARLPEELREGALAAAAREMGRMLDRPGNSATSKSMCAGKLDELMGRLRELAPPVEEADWLDELAERRARREAAA